MSSRLELLDKFNILSKANSFLQSRNLALITDKLSNHDHDHQFKHSSYLISNEKIDIVAPSVEQLDKLLFHTIYNSVSFWIIEYKAFTNTLILHEIV